MKYFYAQEELSKLPKEEIKDIVCFGSDGQYFYSDISNITGSTIIMNNGKELSVSEPSRLDEIKDKLIRWKMTSVSNNTKNFEDILENTIKELNTKMLENMNQLRTSLLDSIKPAFINSENNLRIMKSNINKSNEDISEIVEKLNKHEINTEKLDKIINIFDELLK